MARHATAPEIIKINDLLREHMEVLKQREGDEPGLARYKGDWSDKGIAQVVSPTLSAASVASIRVQMFGHIRMPAMETASQEDFDKLLRVVDQLNKTTNQQHVTIKEMQERFNRLVYGLHLKQVADVKHLCFVQPDGVVPGVSGVRKVAS